METKGASGIPIGVKLRVRQVMDGRLKTPHPKSAARKFAEDVASRVGPLDPALVKRVVHEVFGGQVKQQTVQEK